VGPALALAAGVAGATILNPFFDPRMALAVYADVPSAFVLAMCVAAYWRAASEPDAGAWWRMAAPTVVVLLLRETGIVLAAGIGLGLLLLLGRRSWRGFGVLALTSVAAFIGWRLYLWSAGLPSGLTPRPIAEWDWNAPWTVVRTLVTDRLANNRLIGAVTIVVAGVAAVAAVIGVLRAKDSRIRDLIVICAAVAVVWLAFLAWSYMAAFSPGEVATAASAWRYISELGPTFIFACFAAVGAALPAAADLEPRARIRLRWIGAVACVLVPASLLATWKYWRFDCRYADIVALRTIVAPLKTAGVGDQPMAIVHPTDAFGYAITLDYELHRPMGTSLGVATAEGASQPFRLDVRQIDRSALARNGMRPPVILMRRERDGWTTVLAIPSAPLPACTLAE